MLLVIMAGIALFLQNICRLRVVIKQYRKCPLDDLGTRILGDSISENLAKKAPGIKSRMLLFSHGYFSNLNSLAVRFETSTEAITPIMITTGNAHTGLTAISLSP